MCATKWHNKPMKRVFKTRHFSRWVRKTELTDNALCTAVAEMAQGLIDADLGGGIVKKRVGLAGRGKRGGARTLVATSKGNRWFFVYGFEKNDRIIGDRPRYSASVPIRVFATGRRSYKNNRGQTTDFCYTIP